MEMSEFNKTIDATKDGIRVLTAMSQVNDLIEFMVNNYAEYMGDECQKKLDEVKKEMKKSIHQANVALEDVFGQLNNYMVAPAEKPKYESFIIPRELITYENDKKILIQIPEEMEYGGYSTWFSKKFVTEDPSGEMLQVRMYPDWMISMYQYAKDENGRYQAADTKKEIAENLFRLFSSLEAVNQKDDLAAAL